MSSAPTGTLLSSVKNQFERLAEQSERDLVLILFEPGPRVSLKDALLMCPFSRDHCPDGPPDAQSIVRLRRIDERTIQEFIFASPHAGKTRGEFLKLARHSTITLTMDRYSHVGLLDMNTALETVPDIAFTATFTDERSTDPGFSCTKVATPTVQLTDYQELSQKTAAAGDDSSDSRNVISQEELSEDLTSPEKWWRGDLNPRPAGYESAALTN